MQRGRVREGEGGAVNGGREKRRRSGGGSVTKEGRQRVEVREGILYLLGVLYCSYRISPEEIVTILNVKE